MSPNDSKYHCNKIISDSVGFIFNTCSTIIPTIRYIFGGIIIDYLFCCRFQNGNRHPETRVGAPTLPGAATELFNLTVQGLFICHNDIYTADHFLKR